MGKFKELDIDHDEDVCPRCGACDVNDCDCDYDDDCYDEDEDEEDDYDSDNYN